MVWVSTPLPITSCVTTGRIWVPGAPFFSGGWLNGDKPYPASQSLPGEEEHTGVRISPHHAWRTAHGVTLIGRQSKHLWIQKYSLSHLVTKSQRQLLKWDQDLAGTPSAHRSHHVRAPAIPPDPLGGCGASLGTPRLCPPTQKIKDSGLAQKRPLRLCPAPQPPLASCLVLSLTHRFSFGTA